jgi:hypothetical protein
VKHKVCLTRVFWVRATMDRLVAIRGRKARISSRCYYPGAVKKRVRSLELDVLIAGGGPAGLTAALILGRCRRRVLICDSGSYRNQSSPAIHGLLAHDGESPQAFLAAARDDVRRYPCVRQCASKVREIRRDGPPLSFRMRGWHSRNLNKGVARVLETSCRRLPEEPRCCALSCAGVVERKGACRIS